MRRKIGVISQWEHLVKRYPEAVQHFNVKLLGTDNGDSHAAAAAAARSATLTLTLTLALTLTRTLTLTLALTLTRTLTRTLSRCATGRGRAAWAARVTRSTRPSQGGRRRC